MGKKSDPFKFSKTGADPKKTNPLYEMYDQFFQMSFTNSYGKAIAKDLRTNPKHKELREALFSFLTSDEKKQLAHPMVLKGFAHKIFSQGRDKYDHGDYEEAANNFKIAAIFDSDEYSYIFSYAAALQMNCEYEKAFQPYITTAFIHADKIEPLVNALECAVLLEDWNSARDFLQMIANKKKNDPENYLKAVSTSSGIAAMTKASLLQDRVKAEDKE